MSINLFRVYIISLVVTLSEPRDVTETNSPRVTEPSDTIYIDLKKKLEIVSLSHVIVNLEEGQTTTTSSTDNPPVVINTTTLNCESSLEDFPTLFTHEQRKQGAILIPFCVGFYCFCFIAIICDKYFIPCVEKICDALNLSEDVAAATFMAIATSAPELFVNIIGTFITHSDIGIGTIVGSSMFNTLGVASVGGLFAKSPIKIAWWPLTRDCFIYICAVIFLVVITWDGTVVWYESLSLFIAYFVYFFIMYQNDRISKVVFKVADYCTIRRKKCCKRTNEVKIQIEHISANHLDTPPLKFTDVDVIEQRSVVATANQEEEYNIFARPKGKWYSRAMFYFTWPVRFVLYFTVPDPKKYPRVFPLTFVMCIVWIASNSYLVSWMISVIGGTFEIPDAVLGLTFLAAGGCLPEAISIAILSRKGEGKMGVSNALGANSMNILLSLGLPWFIKTMLVGDEKQRSINIESGSLEYTILTLILVAIALYFTLSFAKFKLSRKTGLVTAVFYLMFLTFAIVSDLVIFPQRDCNVVAS